MNFKEVLTELPKRPEAHARFVNTLSLLEYIGARKILKSQNAESLSMRILHHAAEEIRHAQILKGLALQLSRGILTSYSEDHLLCGIEARAYFQNLDQACTAALPGKNAEKNYILTTLLIEERALKIYPEYEGFLKENQIPNALKSILKDEGEHLSEMQAHLADKPELRAHLDYLRSFEEDRFQDFLVKIHEELRQEKSLRKEGTPVPP